jgi:hypothetical protein
MGNGRTLSNTEASPMRWLRASNPILLAANLVPLVGQVARRSVAEICFNPRSGLGELPKD